jgi:hypothetical protein
MAIIAAIAVANGFEERSLYSYLLKSGDNDATSASAHHHVAGARKYGRLLALEIACGSGVLCFGAGFVLGRRR